MAIINENYLVFIRVSFIFIIAVLIILAIISMSFALDQNQFCIDRLGMDLNFTVQQLECDEFFSIINNNTVTNITTIIDNTITNNISEQINLDNLITSQNLNDSYFTKEDINEIFQTLRDEISQINKTETSEFDYRIRELEINRELELARIDKGIVKENESVSSVNTDQLKQELNRELISRGYTGNVLNNSSFDFSPNNFFIFIVVVLVVALLGYIFKIKFIDPKNPQSIAPNQSFFDLHNNSENTENFKKSNFKKEREKLKEEKDDSEKSSGAF